MEFETYPISLVVAVQTSANSGAVIDKLGGSGILFTELLSAHAGETAVISFSDRVKVHQDFTDAPGPVIRALRMLRKEGGRARSLDGMRRALAMLATRPPGRRRILLFIAEKRDGGSAASLPEVVELLQRVNASVYWLTYSPFLQPFTVRPKTVEDLKPVAERDKVNPDRTPVPPDLGPGGILYGSGS